MLGQGVLHACISIILAACVFYVITRLRKIDEHIHQLYRSMQNKVSAPDVIGVVHAQIQAHQPAHDADHHDAETCSAEVCPLQQEKEQTSPPDAQEPSPAPDTLEATQDHVVTKQADSVATQADSVASDEEYNVVETKKVV